MLYLIIIQRKYSLSGYFFYKEHLEYTVGFYNLKKEILLYKDIEKIVAKPSIFYNIYAIKTIVIRTKTKKIILYDIPFPDEIVITLKKLIVQEKKL